MEQLTASVVIPTRNGAGTLPEQLAALAQQQFAGRFEVIVVDNGSTDEIQSVVAQWHDKLEHLLLISEPHPGANHARNAGVRAASTDLILLCDCDDVVDELWVHAMTTGAATAPLLGGALDHRRLNSVADRHRLGVPERVEQSGDRYQFLPAPYGANCAFDRAAWDAVGGFDQDLRHGGEDFDFFWRAQLAGFEYRSLADAVVHYRLRPASRDVVRRQYIFGVANVQIYRKFRAYGMPTTSVMSALKAWMWIFVNAPLALAIRRRRLSWLQAVAKRAGRVVGCARHRVLYL